MYAFWRRSEQMSGIVEVLINKEKVDGHETEIYIHSFARVGSSIGIRTGKSYSGEN